MHRALPHNLRGASIDVLTVAEAGRRGLSDEEQLAFAASQGRAVFTCNVPDFARLHDAWVSAGRQHAGIILLTNQATPVGAQIRALVRLATALDPATMQDRLEFLTNWQDLKDPG